MLDAESERLEGSSCGWLSDVITKGDKNMSEWNSSNHFKCVHYEDSSWCKKMKSKIWENDPCPEFHPSMSTADVKK